MFVYLLIHNRKKKLKKWIHEWIHFLTTMNNTTNIINLTLTKNKNMMTFYSNKMKDETEVGILRIGPR